MDFICFCTAKPLTISLHLPTIIAFTPLSIPYSTIAGWLLLNISLRVIIFIVRRSKSLKKYGTDLIGSLELNKLSISELSLSVSLSVTFQKIIDISENYRYRSCFCVLTLILLKKNYFFERCDVIEFSWSRLPYFTRPMKILMKMASFADGKHLRFKVFLSFVITIYSDNFRGKSITCFQIFS